jgi:hypothetical protein
VRKRTPARTDASDLPPDLARGPDPRVWAPGSGNPHDASAAWHRAGEAWAKARGLGGNGWLKYLHPHIEYVSHSLGRFHVSRGGLIPPWEDGYDPRDYETIAGVSARDRSAELLFRGDGEETP